MKAAHHQLDARMYQVYRITLSPNPEIHCTDFGVIILLLDSDRCSRDSHVTESIDAPKTASALGQTDRDQYYTVKAALHDGKATCWNDTIV